MRTLRLFCFYFSPSARWTIEQSTLSWCLNCGISVFFFLSDAKRHSANSSPFLLKQNSKKYAHISNELFAVCAPLLAVRWSFFFPPYRRKCTRFPKWIPPTAEYFLTAPPRTLALVPSYLALCSIYTSRADTFRPNYSLPFVQNNVFVLLLFILRL